MDIYILAEIIIVIEFVLILVVMIATYLLKVVSVAKKRNKATLTVEIQHHLKQLITNPANFKMENFPNKWRKIHLLMPVVNDFDTTMPSGNWQTLRVNLFHTIVLPLARKAATSYHWPLRFFAAEAFTLAMAKNDEPLVLKLVHDSVPLVYLHALKSALAFGSENAINAIIMRMSKERRLSQTPYLQAFDSVAPNTRPLIEKHLKVATDPFERATCYKILLKYSSENATWDIQPDIDSNVTELKLAAIKFMAYTSKDSAISKLAVLLRDPHWEIRVVALHALSQLSAAKVIPLISGCLHDPVWWVRISAADALKKLGEPGEAELRAQDITSDKFSFDMAQHVLKTLN
jgi:hypothetical protein